MGIFFTLRIQLTCAELFRKRETILYPSFHFYPGGASNPWSRWDRECETIDRVCETIRGLQRRAQDAREGAERAEKGAPDQLQG